MVEKEEEERVKENEGKEEGLKDVEKGEMGFESTQNVAPREFQMSRMQRLSATNPLRLVINGATRVPSVNPPAQQQQQQQQQQPHHLHHPTPSPPMPRSTPTPQVNLSLSL